MKARRIKTGVDFSEMAIKREGAKLALVDAKASEGTRKVMIDACRFAGIPLAELPEDALGRAIGKPGRMAAAVMDAGFAAKLAQLLEKNMIEL